MNKLDEKRYTISQVSEKVGIPLHTLRRWEDDFPQLKPRRNRAGRRYYLTSDIDIVRRIKDLLRNDKMTTEGARLRLSEELHGEGRPRTKAQAIEFAARIEAEARAMLDTLDSWKTSLRK